MANYDDLYASMREAIYNSPDPLQEIANYQTELDRLNSLGIDTSFGQGFLNYLGTGMTNSWMQPTNWLNNQVAGVTNQGLNYGLDSFNTLVQPDISMLGSWEQPAILNNGQVNPNVANVTRGADTSSSLGLGFNMPTLGLAIQGLSALGNLYQGLQANKLAKKQFNFQKDFANTNLNNQMQSYNTALTDRAYARASMDSNFDPEKYIEENRLTR